jgi:negative elongation factor C/D
MGLEEEGETNEEIRAQCLRILATRDAIMEPGVFDLLKRYAQCGGSPEEVVKLLSENYVGLAQSANLLIQWLQVAGVSKEEINTIIENYLKNLIKRHFDPQKADSIFEETGTTPTWLEDMIVRPTWRELFYELAEQYPNCLMMKFTLQVSTILTINCVECQYY